MKFISAVFTITALALTAGCASVNSVSLTPIPAKRSHVVRAETSRLIILAFNFDNDYVDILTKDLASQCPGGKVTGILTKDETFFYVFAHKRHVVATGYCVGANETAETAGKVPGRKTGSI